MQELLTLTPNWNWKRGMAILVLVTFSTLLVITPTLASADEGEENQSSEAGLGVASGLLTIVYLPFKLAYAVGGGVVGGLTYVLTGANMDVAKSVWEPSFYGTYVITPDHLKGNEPVRFFGVSPYEEEGYEELEYDEEPYEKSSEEEKSTETPETEKP
ncbi:MAG: hypothetical protein JSU59_06065 [Nitrospirota bacterium]|nr:MAG: hypothetical protein JSU59_06065 [Nitrospirota bacterium]